jgi:benzoyl-CoA reductase/2-hydroxyglutaryl-CoA dehydratase subunit BcrC/BadD/HgdB
MRQDDVIFDWVAQAGGRVVLDATEGGERTLPDKFDAARVRRAPLAELTRAYFEHIPDAFRRPNTALYEWLGERVRERAVRGIVLRRYLWCDLWHAERERFRQWSPVPVLDLDMDREDDGARSRTLGRLEAFLETLA